MKLNKQGFLADSEFQESLAQRFNLLPDITIQIRGELTQLNFLNPNPRMPYPKHEISLKNISFPDTNTDTQLNFQDAINYAYQNQDFFNGDVLILPYKETVHNSNLEFIGQDDQKRIHWLQFLTPIYNQHQKLKAGQIVTVTMETYCYENSLNGGITQNIQKIELPSITHPLIEIDRLHRPTN